MRIAAVETFIVTVPRDTPYLGPLGPGERVNARGYLVRRGNGTIYPAVDRSIVVRLTAADGRVGWGETYGICAPRATCEIINDLLAPVLMDGEVDDVPATWDRLYDLMRVRGCTGGFHGDALAALDIALWDLAGKAKGKPVRDLIGATVNPVVPSYLSGLPAATLAQRVDLARDWQARGVTAFKFAAVVSHEGVVEEMAALRSALGPDADILIDLHWKFTADEARALISRLEPYRPGFVEAPLKPEDMAGLAALAAHSPIPVAAGEEWYTAHEFANRLAFGPIAYVQPEMGHTGITQFVRIARLAAEHGIAVAPHATIGAGIFLAASLQASATLPGLWKHEWQHSVFERNLKVLETGMNHTWQGYSLPTGPGLGVEPGEAFWTVAEPVS